MTDGLAIYLDSHDVAAIADTKATLRRCGAVAALVVIESVDGRRQSIARVRAVCAELRSIDVAPTLYSFPSVSDDLDATLAHYERCREATAAPGQWDIEPKRVIDRGMVSIVHWSQASLDRALAVDPEASVTSTRAEVPRLQLRGRRLWLQLESQTSTLHLDRTTAIYPDAVLVTGTFDAPSDPRTVEEVRMDLERCTTQAQRIGAHGVWSAHTITDAKADLLRAWVVETWRAAA